MTGSNRRAHRLEHRCACATSGRTLDHAGEFAAALAVAGAVRFIAVQPQAVVAEGGTFNHVQRFVAVVPDGRQGLRRAWAASPRRSACADTDVAVSNKQETRRVRGNQHGNLAWRLGVGALLGSEIDAGGDPPRSADRCTDACIGATNPGFQPALHAWSPWPRPRRRIRVHIAALLGRGVELIAEHAEIDAVTTMLRTSSRSPRKP